MKALNKALKKKVVTRTYFITATAKLKIEYITKQNELRGNKIYYEDAPVAQSIIATSREEVKEKFDNVVRNDPLGVAKFAKNKSASTKLRD